MYHPDFVTLYVLAASRCIIPSGYIEINPADVSDFELAELFDIKYSRDAIQAMLESGQYQIIGVFDEPWDESLAKEYLSFTDGIREYLGPRFKQTFGLQSRKPPQAPQQPISGNLHPALPQPVYTPEPIVPYRAPRYQYQFLLYCPYDYFFQHLGYSFALASPHRYLEHTAAAAVKYDVNSVELSPQLFRLEYCTEQPAPLNFICYARSKLLNLFYPKVTLQPEGAAPQPVDSAMVIRPLIQIGARLMQPTVGYFYALLYLEQGLELREYKIEDPRTGRFWLTLTQLDYHQKNVLVDDNPSHTVRSKEILLYYQRNGVTVESQYLLYRATRPKESDWQAMIARDSHWLSEHAIQFDPEAALQALTVPLQKSSDPSRPAQAPTRYQRLQHAEYLAEHQQAISCIDAEPRALDNPTNTPPEAYAIPVVNVKDYGEPWLIFEDDTLGGMRYLIEPVQQETVVRYVPSFSSAPVETVGYRYSRLIGTLDSNGYAKVFIPPDLVDKELAIRLIPAVDWSPFWLNLGAGMQILVGITAIGSAVTAQLMSLGGTSLLSLGLTVWGADQVLTGIETLYRQQPQKSQIAQGLDKLGVNTSDSELVNDMLGVVLVAGVPRIIAKNLHQAAVSQFSLSLLHQNNQVLIQEVRFQTKQLYQHFKLRRTTYRQPSHFADKFNALSHQKAAAAEYNAHKLMLSEKHKPLGSTNGNYKVGRTGIDSIYLNRHPPPTYLIVETKWGHSQLGYTKAGKQMSNEWILYNDGARLKNMKLKDKDLFELIKEIKKEKAQKLLIRYHPDGKITKQLLNKQGNLLR